VAHQETQGRAKSEIVDTNTMRFPGMYRDSAILHIQHNWHRYYNPRIGRYYQADPLGVHGDETNLYAYALNNPLRYTDPSGLITEVIIWQPIAWGRSSFGHVSININSTSYSYSLGGMYINPTSDYIKQNTKFREGIGMILKLTLAQEIYLNDYLRTYDRDYNWFTNNSCGDPLENALENLGFNMGTIVFPVGLGNTFMDMGLVDSYNCPNSQIIGGLGHLGLEDGGRD